MTTFRFAPATANELTSYGTVALGTRHDIQQRHETTFNWRDLVRPLSVMFSLATGMGRYRVADESATADDEIAAIYASESTLESIKELQVEVPRLSQVRRYLLDHPDILGGVFASCIIAIQRFPEDAVFTLDLYTDPEIEDSYLTLYIRLREYDARALGAIRDILRERAPFMSGLSGRLLVMPDIRAMH